MIDYGDIGARVRMGRESLGLSQADLAARAGVSRATIARVEAGGAESVAFGAMIRILNAANWSIYLEFGVSAPAVEHEVDIDAYLKELYGDAL